jgi:hypothetical protein
MQNIGLYVLAILTTSQMALGVTGYESLANWNDLPKPKYGVTAGLASSYDRDGYNRDFNHYEWPVGFQTTDVDPVTITEVTGPGIITRFWMPHAIAHAAMKMKLTIDGQVVIDTNTNTYLHRNYGYSTAPLTATLIGGQVSYEPIVFIQSLKIESNNSASGSWRSQFHYYQYGYHKLLDTDGLIPYSGTLTAEQQSARNQVVTMIDNVGTNPAGESQSSTTLTTGPNVVPSGETLVVASLSGSGTVRRLNLSMPGANDASLDGLRLRISYDGTAQYAVDVPVAHFFGVGHGRASYGSLPLGSNSPQGYYCYWPMPYSDGATIELYNSTAGPISIASAIVEYEPGPVALDSGRFHAAWSEEITAANQQDHTLLDVVGFGHYVGNLLYLVKNGTNREILEGDDIVSVDGDLGKRLFGTGLEDAYNGGYYYNHVVPQTDDGDVAYPLSGTGPYHGLLLMEDGSVDPTYDHIRTDQYRWLVGDYVPFSTEITVVIENTGRSAGVLFGSTAFYYSINLIGGDTDRDGDVDLVDLGNLAGAYGMTSGATWEMGDFNGDGDVDLSDLGALAGNYGYGVSAPLNFAADAAKLGLSNAKDATADQSGTESKDNSQTLSPVPGGCIPTAIVVMMCMAGAFFWLGSYERVRS